MQAFYDLDVVDRLALEFFCVFYKSIDSIGILVCIALCKQFAKLDRPKSSCPNLIKAAAAQFGLFQFAKLIIPERQFSDRTCLRPYSDDFKTFLSHIQKEYDIDHSVDEWSLIKVLQNGFGMHHGKLPKYIQQEILDQFNKGTFDVLFCTSTIVEGVNTDAQNMIILNASKGSKKLTPFDIKNIKGRAGRYYINHFNTEEAKKIAHR